MFHEITPFLMQSVIGSIMYAMLGTQPDLAFSIMRLTKFASNPSKHHMRLAQYVLCYLRGTKDYALCYDGDSNSGLIAYSDSDWAEDHDNRHSTSSFVFLMANCVVFGFPDTKPQFPSLQQKQSVVELGRRAHGKRERSRRDLPHMDKAE